MIKLLKNTFLNGLKKTCIDPDRVGYNANTFNINP